MRTVKTIAVAAAALALGTGAALADDAAVKFRKANMEIIGGHMHSIVAIVKGEVPHKDQLAAHAAGLAAAADLSAAAFKAETMGDKEKTTAKAEIWQDWDTFAQGLDKMTAEATKLAEVAGSGDMGAIGAQVQNVGKTCKGCHDDFRKKED